MGEENEEPSAGVGVEIRVMAGKAEEFPGWSSEQKCFYPWTFIRFFEVEFGVVDPKIYGTGSWNGGRKLQGPVVERNHLPRRTLRSRAGAQQPEINSDTPT